MIKNIYMPNIGNYESIVVTNIMISNTSKVKKNDKIITVESGKASVDVVSPYSGKIVNINISVNQNIKPGYILFRIKIKNEKTSMYDITKLDDLTVYSSSNIKKITRKFKIDSKNLDGTTINKRIIKSDVFKLKNDWSKNTVFKKTLSKKKCISNDILLNSWKKIPHVTQFLEIDISTLMNTYLNEKNKMKKQKINLILLPFIIKAVVMSLIKYPYFNASLYDKKNIILKKHYNIGIVTARKDGLITPVIKNAEKKNIFNLNNELLLNKKKIDNNELMPSALKDGSFSISNLGSHTNGFFTPIIKYPEVAILGLSKYQLKPVVKKNRELELKTLLPISLSYDHRIIDGLDCLNFIKHFHNKLNEIKNIYDK